MEVVDAAAHVVVGGLLVRDGRVLLVHRSPARRWCPDVWDVPGGHVEDGEEPAAALARELHEELGVSPEVTGPPLERVHAQDFVMDVWVVRAWTGRPVNRQPAEHDAIAWVAAGEVDGWPTAHPSLPGQVRRALSRSGTTPPGSPL